MTQYYDPPPHGLAIGQFISSDILGSMGVAGRHHLHSACDAATDARERGDRQYQLAETANRAGRLPEQGVEGVEILSCAVTPSDELGVGGGPVTCARPGAQLALLHHSLPLGEVTIRTGPRRGRS